MGRPKNPEPVYEYESEERAFMTAIHEAAHVFAALEVGSRVTKATVKAVYDKRAKRFKTLGMAWTITDKGVFADDPDHPGFKKWVKLPAYGYRRSVICLAAYYAEIQFFGYSDGGCFKDFRTAAKITRSKIASRIYREDAVSKWHGSQGEKRVHCWYYVKEETKAFRKGRDDASSIVAKRRVEIEAFARSLAASETLEGEALKTAIELARIGESISIKVEHVEVPQALAAKSVMKGN